MKASLFGKNLTRFLLYSRSMTGKVPLLEQLSAVSMYTLGLSFLFATFSSLRFVLMHGLHISAVLLVLYSVIAVMGFVLFWNTRTLTSTRIVYGLGAILVVAQQFIDMGGVYGLGIYFFLFAFPVVYLFFGLRFSSALLLTYCAGLAVRMKTGVFSALSIYNDPAVVDRTLVIIFFAAMLELVICICNDRLIEYLSRQAFYDYISGLPNKLKIKNTLKRDLWCYRDGKHEFSAIAIKILNLSRVNTLLGTEGCDSILKEIGRRLSAYGLETRIAGRWSSSIFIILADLHEFLETEQFAVSLLESLSAPYMVEGRTVSIGFTLSVSRYPEDTHSGASIIDNAISLLDMNAPQSGEIRFFNEENLQLQQYRYSLLENLNNADFDRAFRLVYQPKVRIADRKCAGAEALLRWHDDQFGEVSPGVFIPMAEQTGFIRKITRWVIRRCVSDIVALREADPDAASDLVFSVNLSVSDLRDKGLIEFLGKEVLSVPGIAALLEFEITEGIMLDEDARIKKNLEHLLYAGFRIVIDDFGTGYSSLSYLHKIRVHGLKIDQSFIANLFSSESADETPVVNAIISMSKSLKLQITAEGVETEEQFAWLRKKGCDLAQGFLFSPGIPMRDFYSLYCKNREVGEVGACSELDELERTGGDLTETTIAIER